MKTKLLVGTLALGATAFCAGCVASAQAGGYVEADAPVVFVEEPTLVLVEPSIWVVRDYDYAVYYVDDYYWVYRGDAWYRSRMYDSGWATVNVSVVPRLIVHRDHNVYVHCHGAAGAQTRKPHERPAARADHDRSEHADDHRDGPSGRDKDEDRGPPEHANDHRGAPPGQDKDKDRGPPEHANDHHDAAPGHDGRPGANPRDDKAADEDKRDNGKRDDKEKRDENRADDDKKHGENKRQNGKK